MKSFPALMFPLILTFVGPSLANAEKVSPTSEKADIKFEKKKIMVGSVPVTVEIADTPARGERGLMFRTKLADGDGMIFIFADQETRNFWMKNTFIDLAIGFFDAKKKLIDIQEMKAVKSEMEADPPTYPSAGPAKYALEVPKGWFTKHKVKLGDHFSGL